MNSLFDVFDVVYGLCKEEKLFDLALPSENRSAEKGGVTGSAANHRMHIQAKPSLLYQKK